MRKRTLLLQIQQGKSSSSSSSPLVIRPQEHQHNIPHTAAGPSSDASKRMDHNNNNNNNDDDDDSNKNNVDKAVIQYSGFSVFFMIFVAYIIFHGLLDRRPEEVLAVTVAILAVNGLDAWAKAWETKKEDVLDFKRRLRQSLMPASVRKNGDGDDDDGQSSDSSESYDPERHCGNSPMAFASKEN